MSRTHGKSFFFSFATRSYLTDIIQIVFPKCVITNVYIPSPEELCLGPDFQSRQIIVLFTLHTFLSSAIRNIDVVVLHYMTDQ